jgi:hypothetical protein
MLSKVPQYMAPTVFLQISSLPVTPNGKLDRRALPKPDGGRPALCEDFVAPCDQVEEAIAAIWCDLLGLSRVGMKDNFFALGGNSLLAVRLQTRLNEVFGQRLSVVEIFRCATIAELRLCLSGLSDRSVSGAARGSAREQRRRAMRSLYMTGKWHQSSHENVVSD